MQQLPDNEIAALVLRTDFTNDTLWQSLCESVQQPDPVWGFLANVYFVNDPQYEGVTAEQLPALMSSEPRYSSIVFIVDAMTLFHAENPILVVDLRTRPVQTFRTLPSQMWGVENNLSLCNMDFEEFASAVDADGIFRGFPEG